MRIDETFYRLVGGETAVARNARLEKELDDELNIPFGEKDGDYD